MNTNDTLGGIRVEQLDLKKILTKVVGVIVLLVGVYFVYEYVSEPKMVDGVVSKKIFDKEYYERRTDCSDKVMDPG